MKELVFIDKNEIVTDSLMVAEVFEKPHKDILKKIRNLDCSKEFTERNFSPSTYNDSTGRSLSRFLIKRDGLVFLVMGFTGVKAAEYKEKYIEAFNNMEEALKNKVQMASYMIEDPIARAERWIEEQKEKKLLETQKLMLEQQVKEYEPKVTYYDEILKSTDVINITQIAKDYGISGKALNTILRKEKVQYKQNGQWLLYSQHQDKGFTKSHTQEFIKPNGEKGSKLHTKWTQKGRLFIHSLLLKRGIEAVIDRELNLQNT
ncbi:phage antirepressor KilAC domain-containing protein [Heyndrickxia camelliae]|uniref:Rha family transcriptional regulator n=1 Tax=Heyndrickxia camelliae TaxID=1707093 RepID=A0A2N3LD05_9BACI|nr:phage regulatory protein/antirepressor Ant [Heyndrickxia camelliae]PKR82427.1 Rha family transcriptional regulator [Heyndrickxia camelliae]